MKRVLFVDDEPHILAGLRNTLRRQRDLWDMHFSASAKEALDLLATEPFDVIVTDMRMPVMNGAALLKESRQRFPEVARIVLSGQADRTAIAEALPHTQQFLSKPCNPTELQDVIGRVCQLQDCLQTSVIRDVVGNIDSLPPFPETYWRLVKTLEREDASADQVATIVEEDPALALKVLQLTNSAFFGRAQSNPSIRNAVSYLGVELIKGLTLVAHVFGAAPGGAAQRALDGVRDRSIVTAKVARRLVDAKLSDLAFSAGLLHDVGLTILAKRDPEKMMLARERARSEQRPYHVVEHEAFGCGHAEVGAFMLGLWGLPLSIVEVAAHHHQPERLQATHREVLAAVHVADLLVDAAFGEIDEGGPRFNEAFLREAGVLASLPAWLEKARNELARMPPLV